MRVRAGMVVNMRFTFRDTITDAPVTIPSFAMSYLDIDGGDREQLQVDSFSSFTTLQPANNLLDLGDGSCESPSSYGSPCRAFRGCSNTTQCAFSSPSEAMDSPNPRDPMQMTAQMQAHSVTFLFESKSAVP